MLSVGSCKLFIRNMLLCLPNLYAVNDVLPQDITARSYRRQGREVGTGYPYGEGGVLLSESLAGVHRLTEPAAYGATTGELKTQSRSEPMAMRSRNASVVSAWKMFFIVVPETMSNEHPQR